MSSKRAYAPRAILAVVLLFGVALQPILVRCVDASGKGSIELAGADCCMDGKSTDGSAPAVLLNGDCNDESLSVLAIRGSSESERLSRAQATGTAYVHPPFIAQPATRGYRAVAIAFSRAAHLSPHIHLCAQLNC